MKTNPQIQFIQIHKYICPESEQGETSQKLFVQGYHIFLITFKNCIENVALVFIMGRSNVNSEQVNRNAPDVV